MPLVIGFAELLGAALLLTSAITGAKFSDVIAGRAGQLYRTSAPGAAPGIAPGAAPGGPSGGYTQETWARALLATLNIPATNQAIANIVSWERQEGGNWNNTAAFNPLNTTEDAPGAKPINSAGVKAYTGWEQGLAATAQTLAGTDYSGVVAALGAPSDVFEAAVNASPWGTKF